MRCSRAVLCPFPLNQMSLYYAPRHSRLSVRPRARDSVFPGGSEWHCADSESPFSPDLLGSVLAMEDCCEEVRQKKNSQPFVFFMTLMNPSQAYEAQQILRDGTVDLRRMTQVLDNQRVWNRAIGSRPFMTQDYPRRCFCWWMRVRWRSTRPT